MADNIVVLGRGSRLNAFSVLRLRGAGMLPLMVFKRGMRIAPANDIFSRETTRIFLGNKLLIIDLLGDQSVCILS